MKGWRGGARRKKGWVKWWMFRWMIWDVTAKVYTEVWNKTTWTCLPQILSWGSDWVIWGQSAEWKWRQGANAHATTRRGETLAMQNKCFSHSQCETWIKNLQLWSVAQAQMGFRAGTCTPGSRLINEVARGYREGYKKTWKIKIMIINKYPHLLSLLWHLRLNYS